MPSIDLTTLPGWASLSTGSHNITIVARANGYRDSEPSAAVTVKKEYPNVTLKAGTYQFKENPVLPTEELHGTMAFKTKLYGATDYSEFTEIKADSAGIDYNNSTTGASSPVYYNSQWATSTSQRVIIVENDAQVPSDFLTWFENSTYVPLTAGSYQFITDVSLSNVPSNIYVPFTSDGVTYSQINFSSGLRYVSASTTTSVYSATNGWVDQKYRVITVTADTFIYRAQYTWFTANASAYTPTYTLEAGTYKFKDDFDYVYLPNQPLLFKSAGTDYVRINTQDLTGTIVSKLRYYTDNTNFDYVCNINKSGNKVWLDDAYKTITLSTSQEVSEYFYKWAITDGNLVKQEPTYNDCITFTGESSEFTLSIGANGAKEWDGTVWHSTDHNTWTVWDGTAISSVNKKLYLRGSGNTKFRTGNGAYLSLSARAACSGNIQTLLDYNNPPTTLANYCYHSMFRDCTNLTQAPELPATTLATYCYHSMFNGCTSLTQAPELPATTLANNCYQNMFNGCTSLTQAPALPATTLANYCYQSMFRVCTNLTQAPELPATTLATYCYNYMFYGCKSLKISETQSSEYPTAWRIPSSGTISATATNWSNGMLSNTGGTFKSSTSINTTYYGAWTK